jgi:aminoglycoside phosphotransferase (APT) family kinase protein
MEALEIPDTLVHNDINSGNILFEGTHCVFTDWCEAGVGSPFFAFQYLCLLEAHGNGDWAPSLRELYKQCWLDRLSASQIDQAFALTPLLAILAYLYGRGTWLHSPKRNDPHAESYARSLARHMDRAAQDPQLLEVLCR